MDPAPFCVNWVGGGKVMEVMEVKEVEWTPKVRH
jgi:hypothetical protein